MKSERFIFKKVQTNRTSIKNRRPKADGEKCYLIGKTISEKIVVSGDPARFFNGANQTFGIKHRILQPE